MLSSFGGCGAGTAGLEGGCAKKGRSGGALARGLAAPVVFAESRWYLRTMVRPASRRKHRSPTRGRASAREVEGGHETEVVRRPRRRGRLLLAVDDTTRDGGARRSQKAVDAVGERRVHGRAARLGALHIRVADRGNLQAPGPPAASSRTVLGR